MATSNAFGAAHAGLGRVKWLDSDSIAADFGFWEFGRFSGQYRRLFGELPSETLRRSRMN